MNISTDVSIDKVYEIEDHKFRDADQYARGKYDLTIQWLQETGNLQGKSLLNVGCGAGLFNVRAAELGLKVVGVEPDSNTFQLAKESAAGRPIEVRNGDLSVLDDSLIFDYIVMHDVLEHIENDRQTIADLAKRLKSGGTLVLSVPALQFLFGLHDENLGHFRRYSKRQLVKVVATNFQIQSVRYYGFVFIPIVYLLSVVLRKPYPVSQARDGLLNRILGFACRLEAKFPLPLGTSVILRAKK